MNYITMLACCILSGALIQSSPIFTRETYPGGFSRALAMTFAAARLAHEAECCVSGEPVVLWSARGEA